jgi:ERCC4-type nuclease
MEIIADDRENSVSEYFKLLSEKYHIGYQIKRITIGDFAIVRDGKIIVIVERKTWTDLAASIRDGRKENIQKLLWLREQTGCIIMYIIEGNPFYNEDKTVSRMSIKGMRSHLDHLMFRDNVHVSYSSGVDFTANRLFEFARNITTIRSQVSNDTPAQIDEVKTPAPIPISINIDCDEDDNPPKPIVSNGMGENNESSDKVLLSTKDQNFRKPIEALMLDVIPGVSSLLATVLADNNITIRKLYSRECSLEFIANCKYPTGVMVGLIKAHNICNIYKMFHGDSLAAANFRVRLLSSIPGISAVLASIILNTFSFTDIMDGKISKEQLKNLKVGKRKLGPSVTDKIFKFLEIPDK